MSAPRATKADLERALSDKTREAAQARDQLAATSEIWQAINQSPADPQPVFDTILRNAVRLCDAVYGNLLRFDGVMLHLAAHHNFTPEQLAWWRPRFPRPLSPGQHLARVITTGLPLRVADVQTDRDAGITEAARGMKPAQTFVKIIAPQASHKTEVGGVALHLGDAAAVRTAAEAMQHRLRRHDPVAVIDG